jgi:hypothetical protein
MVASNKLRMAVAALLLIAVTAPAHAFRCGTRIITRGDHAEKILRFCGEPSSVHTRFQTRAYVTRFGRLYPGVVEEVVVEEWTFNLGPRHLMRVVRLENGFVEEIKSLGYGF